TFYSLPILTTDKPGDCDSIEVKIINISASEIAKTLNGKYFIIGSDVTFSDTQGMMENIDSGYVHLVLTTYHKIDDISDCGINPQAEVIHAGMVDAEHSSEFKAYAYTYNGKPRIDIGGNADKCCGWEVTKKAHEVNAPYVIELVSRLFVCNNVETKNGDVYFNNKYVEYTWYDPEEYMEIAPGSIVKMDLANGFGDFDDEFYGTSECLFEDIKCIGEYASPV
ncbi:MAG: hypothetical protein K2M99_03450, partial [Treponemataceae bacterium]|nr:hypothetical protein [Treponemataceae bacterium]